MQSSRMEALRSFATCSREFCQPEVASEQMRLKSRPEPPCLSVATRSSGKQSSRGSVARFSSVPDLPGGTPARVLLAGQALRNRQASVSVILCTVCQRAREVKEVSNANSPPDV